jgi:tetratricopeptide (TPR) repeat protein
MRYFYALGTAIFLFQAIAFAQTKEELLEYFEEGEYFFNRDDFQEAAYYYRKLVEPFPDNANFNFKLGECYLNIPGEEARAIPYLEKASEKTVEKNKYKARSFEEKNAPLHALFYLGNAYRINNKLDQALACYKAFMASPYYFGNYNETIVENEVKACERAKIIQDSPVDVSEEILPEPLNTAASEINPVVSGDENTIIFVRKLKFYDAIFLCQKRGEVWSQPENLNPLVGSDGELYPACLSFDGKELYLVKNTPDNKDLYVSYFQDSSWTKAEKLGKTINTTNNETSACISGDGQWLYFTSDRNGGKGGTDIYISKRNSSRAWGKAKNAGKIINSEANEESPSLTHNGKTLYFSSQGHYSMGGYDLFYSRLEERKWSVPVNAGFPINSTADNKNMMVLQGGKIIYLSKPGIDGNTLEDLYIIKVNSYLPLP